MTEMVIGVSSAVASGCLVYFAKIIGNGKVRTGDCQAFRDKIEKKLDAVKTQTDNIAGFLEAIHDRKISRRNR